MKKNKQGEKFLATVFGGFVQYLEKQISCWFKVVRGAPLQEDPGRLQLQSAAALRTPPAQQLRQSPDPAAHHAQPDEDLFLLPQSPSLAVSREAERPSVSFSNICINFL
jgi:hypothetical protein